MKTNIFKWLAGWFLLLPALSAVAQGTASEPFVRKRLVKEVKIQNKAEHYDKSTELLRKAFATYPEAANDAELCNYELTAQMALAQQQSRAIFKTICEADCPW